MHWRTLCSAIGVLPIAMLNIHQVDINVNHKIRNRQAQIAIKVSEEIKTMPCNLVPNLLQVQKDGLAQTTYGCGFLRLPLVKRAVIVSPYRVAEIFTKKIRALRIRFTKRV